MYTHHPSYPPLDLAASGAVIVTNRFANKLDLSAYSNNIICGDLHRESMLEAFAAGVCLVADDAARRTNHQENGLSRSWHTTTASIIKLLAASI
jgi:hypothetical protein